MKPKFALRSLLLLAGSSLLAISSASAQATSATWDEDNLGNWTTVTNWVGDTAYAEGTDNTATFGNTITADRVVTLDTGITIGNITASDTDKNYTISGANILTLDRSDATKPTINVTPPSTRALTISSVIAGSDGLQKTGTGTLTFTSTSNNTFTGGFDISGGVVAVDSTTNANAFGASTNVITFTGNGTIHNTNNAYTIGQAVAVNDGVIATFRGANAENTIVNGIVSGSGEIQITSDSSTMSASFANTANTHTGKLWVGTTGNALNFTANSLADSSTGSLKVGVATGANQTTSFTLGTGTIAPVTLTNRAVELAGGSGSVTLSNNAPLAANAFTITPDLTFTAPNSGNKNLTLSGTNTGANAFNGSIGNNGTSTTSITKTAAGVWTLGNAANGFTGLITVTQSTLNYASAGGSNGITFNNTTGSVTLNYIGSTNQTMSGAINASTVTSGTVTLGSSGSGAVNYSNTGSLGTLTSNTVRKLVLAGTNTGNNTLAGRWVNNTGTSNAATLTKNGAGTWILSGDNAYTGATTVSGGTLKLGADNVLADTTNVSIGAATLNADTFDDTVGTLDVTAAAVINLGTGANLAFADSKAVSWTGGTLNVTGTLGATSLRFGTDNTGLTPIQLGLISVNGSGTGTYILDGSGYLIPSGGGPGPLDHFAISAISSPQTVGTPITGITLTARDASNTTINFTGTVTFGGTGGFTGTSGTFTAGVLSGVSVTPTVAGSGLTFTVTDLGSGKTGTATFNIQTQYQAWAGGGLFDADANGDGVKNGMAFLLGAASPTSAVTQPTVTQSGGALIMTFNCLPVAARGSATLKVEHSTNLATWTATTAVVPNTTNAVPDNNVTFVVGAGPAGPPALNNVTATIGSAAAASGKLFGRLNAQQ